MHTRPPVPVFGAVHRGPPSPTPRQRGGPRCVVQEGADRVEQRQPSPGPGRGGLVGGAVGLTGRASGCRFLVRPELALEGIQRPDRLLLPDFLKWPPRCFATGGAGDVTRGLT